MKKILIDATALSDQYKGRGIGTYAKNIITELVKSRKYKWHLLGFNDAKGSFKKVKFHLVGDVFPSNPQNFLRFRSKLSSIVRKVKPDLFFSPNFERGLPIGKCKTVVMIHDISPLLFNSFSLQGRLINYLKGLFYKYNLNNAKKADLVLVNSEFTKSEIEKVGFANIEVTPLGISHDLDVNVLKRIKSRQKILDKYEIMKPYVFYYGGFEANKNADKLLDSFYEVKKEVDMKLVILDKNLYREEEELIANGLAERIKRKMEKLGILNSVILPKFIPWSDLPIVHAEAVAFVHLSSYEGFGFSPLEAMASGCPVVAADASCYPEILGDGAILVNPKSVEIIKYNILRLMQDETFRKEQITKGKKQAVKYSWEKCGEETLEAFETLLKENKKEE